MTKLIWVASIVVGTACVARTPSIGFRASAGGGGPVGPPPPPPPDVVAVDSGDPGTGVAHAPGGRAPGEDLHWFTADDYLVSKQPYERAKLTNLHVAKMTAVATGQTKAEAKFLVADGDELWTAHYWRTRVATAADFRIGAIAFCNAVSWTSKADAPKTKHESRQEAWIMAAITDTADSYKGRVTVGNVSCAVDGVRVPIR